MSQDSERATHYYGTPNARQNLRIALNLKQVIDKAIIIPAEIHEITRPDSTLLNANVVEAVYNAAGGVGKGKEGTSSRKYRSALPFCLLKVSEWYMQLADMELSAAQLHESRSVAAQQLSKIIIEQQQDERYLFIAMLTRRFTINLNSEDSYPQNVLELSVDMHSTMIISSSGYQRCVTWIWRGWIIQSRENPLSYVLYDGVSDTRFLSHFNPDRIRTPQYQNILEILFSIVYLILYTFIVNTEASASIDFFEFCFYIFTLGYVVDEIVKVYHIGSNYIQFWNAFNDTMYALLSVSVMFRIMAVRAGSPVNMNKFDTISYRLLSCAAPFMWTRLLLFLDVNKFVGTMIVVIKVMMKESAIFFFLLTVILVGFLQGFLGLDQADGRRDATTKILSVLVHTVIGGPDFQSFNKFAPPYAQILYYIFTFFITVILLNILIALYSTAYSEIVDNSTNEYLALVAQKTLRYIRAPDENVYVAPYNLVEFFILPLQWLVQPSTYHSINKAVMTIIYLPLISYVASEEVKIAKRVNYNRGRNLPDDANEHDTEWSLTDGFDDDTDAEEAEEQINANISVQVQAEQEDPEFQAGRKKWLRSVEALVPPIHESSKMGVSLETYDVMKKLETLTALVGQLVQDNKELRQQLLEKK
ncbi:BA75_03088T0 [Komagataella pastoris]|uniref:BA75_03088T0 n=1 Tax=Komagataella pastoris TaxID=4922 RepID=A0A1B2JDM8_PICPA|nr:BA75_03088T0 [Komagataella pastoris]